MTASTAARSPVAACQRSAVGPSGPAVELERAGHVPGPGHGRQHERDDRERDARPDERDDRDGPTRPGQGHAPGGDRHHRDADDCGDRHPPALPVTEGPDERELARHRVRRRRPDPEPPSDERPLTHRRWTSPIAYPEPTSAGKRLCMAISDDRPMPTRERPVDRGTERGRRIVGDLALELRAARVDRGLTLATVGAATRMSISKVSRIERGLAPRVTVIDLARLHAVVGLEMWARSFPGGSPFAMWVT